MLLPHIWSPPTQITGRGVGVRPFKISGPSSFLNRCFIESKRVFEGAAEVDVENEQEEVREEKEGGESDK